MRYVRVIDLSVYKFVRNQSKLPGSVVNNNGG